MTRFLINKSSEDGLSGETDDMKMILHNLSLIGGKYKEDFLKTLYDIPFRYLVQCCVCGRFVTYIEVSKDLKEGEMRFFDLQNDNDKALDAASIIKNKWYGSEYFNWFMEESERIKEVYKDNYDAAELLLAQDVGLLLN